MDGAKYVFVKGNIDLGYWSYLLRFRPQILFLTVRTKALVTLDAMIILYL